MAKTRKPKKDRSDSLSRRTKRGVDEKDSVFVDSYLDLSKAKNDVQFFEPKVGREKNVIDIIPFEVTQDWYKNLKTYTGKRSGGPTGIEVGELDYKLEVPIHSRVGPGEARVLCLREAFGKKCSICDDMFAEYEKDNPDEELISQLRPRWRVVYNIIDYDNEDAGIMLFEISWHLFEKLLLEESKIDDEGYITFSHLTEGKTIEFRGREEKLGKSTFTECHSINFLDREEEYDDDIVADAFSLDEMLTVPTSDEVEALYIGEDLDDEEDDEKEKPVKKKSKSKKKAKKKEVPEDDIDDSQWDDDEGEELEEEDEEPEEEEEKPKRRRGKKKSKPKDECPEGGEFGIDCGELDECEDCDEELYDRCAEKQEELEEEKTKSKKKGKK